MISSWLYADDSTNLWLKSHFHGPEKLTDRHQDEIFSCVFSEIAYIKRREEKLKPLAPKFAAAVEQNRSSLW
jgi:hypothetical protein